MWKFHCEADKGERAAEIAHDAVALDIYLSKLPTYSADPLDDDASIIKSTIREVAKLGACCVVELKFELKESYYTDLYFLLCEEEPGKFLPVYVQQYNRGLRRPKLARVAQQDGGWNFSVVVDYSGTDGGSTTDVISLRVDKANAIQLQCAREAKTKRGYLRFGV